MVKNVVTHKNPSNAVQCITFDFRISQMRADESCFTADQIGQCLLKLCKKFVFQLEQGEQTNYLHFQGRVSLIKPTLKMTLLSQIQKLLSCSIEDAPQYLSPTVKGVHKTQNFNYVLKDSTKKEGPWTEKDFKPDDLKPVQYIPKQYQGIVDKLYPYQKTIIDSRLVFDARIVNVIYDPTGNNGKSTIASLCELLYGGIDVPPINDYKELMQLVCDECMHTQNRSPSPIMIDMPRGMDKFKLAGIYTAIEQIKKGKLFDTRNRYKKYWIDSPQIWVFTNEYPELHFLSADRWKIWKISETKELVAYTAKEHNAHLVTKELKKRDKELNINYFTYPKKIDKEYNKHIDKLADNMIKYM